MLNEKFLILRIQRHKIKVFIFNQLVINAKTKGNSQSLLMLRS